MKRIFFIIVIIGLTAFMGGAFAAEGEKSHGHEESSVSDHDEDKIKVAKHVMDSKEHKHDIKSLDLRIHAIMGKIKELEAQVTMFNAIKPNFTTFMPEFSERFHVMHAAGEAGDWALAAHEILELQRMIKVAKIIDPTKGNLMEGFLSGNFHQLNEAIEHGNLKSFDRTLKETVTNCNNCHIAVAASYILVSLDMDQTISMRHSHKFVESKAGSVTSHKH